MIRVRIARMLWIAAGSLVAAGLLGYVLAQVFDWSSLSSGIAMLIQWGPPSLIALGILLRVLTPRPGGRREGLDGIGDPINDLYLGRVSAPPVPRSVDEYGAYPPPDDTGKPSDR